MVTDELYDKITLYLSDTWQLLKHQ